MSFLMSKGVLLCGGGRVCLIFSQISLAVSMAHLFFGLPARLFGGVMGSKVSLLNVIFLI